MQAVLSFANNWKGNWQVKKLAEAVVRVEKDVPPQVMVEYKHKKKKVAVKFRVEVSIIRTVPWLQLQKTAGDQIWTTGQLVTFENALWGRKDTASHLLLCISHLFRCMPHFYSRNARPVSEISVALWKIRKIRCVILSCSFFFLFLFRNHPS